MTSFHDESIIGPRRILAALRRTFARWSRRLANALTSGRTLPVRADGFDPVPSEYESDNDDSSGISSISAGGSSSEEDRVDERAAIRAAPVSGENFRTESEDDDDDPWPPGERESADDGIGNGDDGCGDHRSPSPVTTYSCPCVSCYRDRQVRMGAAKSEPSRDRKRSLQPDAEADMVIDAISDAHGPKRHRQ